MKAAPSCSIAALISGTSWVLSPEKPRATKVAPSCNAIATRSIELSALITPRFDFEPRSAEVEARRDQRRQLDRSDRKSTRLNSSHLGISYAVFCLKKKKTH